MRSIADIESEIESYGKSLAPFLFLQKELKEGLRSAKARQFIEANSITLDDVEVRDRSVWYRSLDVFLASDAVQDSTKRFIEWMDTIYFRSDLMAGKMPDMPATLSDLKLWKKK